MTWLGFQYLTLNKYVVPYIQAIKIRKDVYVIDFRHVISGKAGILYNDRKDYIQYTYVHYTLFPVQEYYVGKIEKTKTYSPKNGNLLLKIRNNMA